MSAEAFVDFVNSSPSPFHASEQSVKALKRSGFVSLTEGDEWELKPGGKYYFTRNQSTVVAFALGGKYTPGNGFAIVGAHTDSPCLRVKPNSKLTKSGFASVGVECYGGGLWNTWFDRDLGLAGRVIVREEGKLVSKLVRIDKPILRVPTLAIHLDRGVNTDGFKFNKETQLVPVLASAAESALSEEVASKCGKHHPLLLSLLADELGCAISDLRDFELCLYDVNPSTIGGARNEYIYSARLDNLESSYCALQALLDSVDDAAFADDRLCRVVVLFDHEEVGSRSAQGADSTLFSHTLHRIAEGRYERAAAKSYIISADMAHAVHPNYSAKHEENHKPELNMGPVIKFNANQRYATNAVTAAILREIAERADVPLQDVMVRNDSGCGSTIGPIVAANLGIRTIDIGNPQLSMHSIREMGGVRDVEYAVRLFQAFFKHLDAVDATVECD